MRKRLIWGVPVVVALLLGVIGNARADTVTLTKVASYPKNGPFGLAFDGTNIWYSQYTSGGFLHEMTTLGVDTGTTVARRDSGALAWDGSHFVAAHGTSSTTATATFWDTSGTVTGTLALSGWNISQASLIDGLDFDHGEIWISPDIASVWRRDGTTGAVIGSDPWKNLGGAGYMSGVERVDVGANTYIIVVNDATTPRSLGVYHLDGTEVGTVQLTNSRYEDLAFDGRYLWAADYFAGRIDKIDLLVNGGSILQNSAVPTPAALPAGLGLLSLLCVGGWLRRRRASASV